RSGLRVLAVEQARYGTDTLSTHALMRGGVLQLHRWGVLPRIEAVGTPRITSTSFHYGEEEIAIAIKPRYGIQGLYAPRRKVLDAILVDAAREAGVEVVHGVRVIDLMRSEDGRVVGAVLEEPGAGTVSVGAELVIGADGLRSKVAELVGAPKYRVGRNTSTFLYGYWSGLDLEENHWYYRPGVMGGAIPTNGGEVLVCAGAPGSRFWNEIRFDLEGGFHRVLREVAPELSDALAGASRSGPVRGFPGEPGFFRRSAGPGWALVGDAGYFRDPSTAHGITDAFRDAELLARAAVQGTDRALEEYERLRDSMAVGLFEASDIIAGHDRGMDEIKKVHLFMSDEMNREVAYLNGLDSEQPEALTRRTA
ncbi:MAG TPA: NAD(P)/FAD-dependent oxidoreductase, partial [Vicinamibacteria bacterium]|nr:NAD(P)/FAD-dependent oxidoreductase [Vicinamibacteria bacterium]